MLNRVILCFGLCFMLLNPMLAYGKDTTYRFDEPNSVSFYRLYWGGVKVGYMIAAIKKEKANQYNFKVIIRSEGLLFWLFNFSSDSESIFLVDKRRHHIMPRSFDSIGKLKKKGRSTHIRYDKSGHVVFEDSKPKRDPSKREPIPEHRKSHTYDPLSASSMAREYVLRYLNGEDIKKFTIPMFDVKRLVNLDFEILGKENLHVHSKPIETVKVRVSRHIAIGATKSERRTAKLEPAIDVYFENNAMVLPIRAESPTLFGNAVIMLERTCDTLEACIPKD